MVLLQEERNLSVTLKEVWLKNLSAVLKKAWYASKNVI